MLRSPKINILLKQISPSKLGEICFLKCSAHPRDMCRCMEKLFSGNNDSEDTHTRTRDIYYIQMIADFHNDVLTKEDGSELVGVSEKVKSCVCAIYTGARSMDTIRGIVRKFQKEKRKNLFLALEDASYLEERNIEEVCGWNPVSVSLTWNARNGLGGGCMSEGGLTERGRCVAKRLAESGIALDCAHLNARSFYDLLDEVPGLVNTHTCLNGVYRHPRNLEDAQIKEIVARGGLIGIAFVGKFLSADRAGMQDVFYHMDYAVQKFGDDHFCFGTDFNGTDDLPEGLKNYEDTESLRDLFYKAGYSQRSVEKIFVENLQNFLAKKS